MRTQSTGNDQPPAPGGTAASQTARTRLTQIQTERAAAGARLSRYRLALAPQVFDHFSAPGDIWEAKLNIVDTERAYAQLALDEEEAQRAFDAAVEADRAELVARYAVKKRLLVAQLAALLEQAREINVALSAAEVEEHEVAHVYLDPLAWPQLTRSDDRREAFLDFWLASARERGLLD